MKKIVVLLCIIASYITLQAQNSSDPLPQYVTDGLKYSLNFPAVTARSLSMGGAFTSLGGDFSSSFTNPAGLGLYRKSEFVVTPALSITNTTADYLGMKNNDSRTHFNFGSFGYIGTYNTNKDKGLVSATLALAYNRQNNFNSKTYIRGTNPDNSLADYFMAHADTYYPDELDAFYERLAFDGYVIDTVPGSPTTYQTPVFLPIDQRRIIETKGGIGQWTMALGLNFSNIVYMGMGFGIHQLQYDRTSVHSEFDNNPANDFSQFDFTEDLKVDGVGYNLSLGMIVRLFKIMRIGGSLQLPTYYRIKENYYNSLYSRFKNNDTYYAIPTDVNGDAIPGGTFDYKLNTPLKLQGGMSVQIGTMGILSADVEFVNYGSLKLKENDYQTDFSGSNSDINSVYKSVVNLKLGGEVRFKSLALRLGGGYYPSPVASLASPAVFSHIGSVPDAYTELTSGIGYRNNNFFIDFGFSWLSHNEKYNLYSVTSNDANVANLKQSDYRLLATMGVRF